MKYKNNDLMRKDVKRILLLPGRDRIDAPGSRRQRILHVIYFCSKLGAYEMNTQASIVETKCYHPFRLLYLVEDTSGASIARR